MTSVDTQIIERLADGGWHTAAELAAIAGCSEKTLRLHVGGLAEELGTHGATVEARRGSGFRLIVSDHEAFLAWREERHRRHRELPNGARERGRYIVERLLSTPAGECVRRSDLAFELFVSEKTVSADLHKLDCLLSAYDLAIERVAGRGLRLVGHEFYRRQYMLSHTMSTLDYKDPRIKAGLHALVPQVRQVLGLSIPDYFADSLIDYLALTVRRLERGFAIEGAETRAWSRDVSIYRAAHAVLGAMLSEGMIESIPAGEPYFLSLFLWGHMLVLPGHNEGDPCVMPSWSFMLADGMLEEVRERFGVDLADDEAREELVDFTGSFDVRTVHHIGLTTPGEALIEREYSDALPLARAACDVLARHYGCEPTAVDLCHVALVLGMALDRATIRPSRLVAYARLRSPYDRCLLARLQRAYGGFFGVIDVRDVSEYDELEATDYDAVISATDVGDDQVIVVGTEHESLEDRWLALTDAVEKTLADLRRRAHAEAVCLRD